MNGQTLMNKIDIILDEILLHNTARADSNEIELMYHSIVWPGAPGDDISIDYKQQH